MAFKGGEGGSERGRGGGGGEGGRGRERGREGERERGREGERERGREGERERERDLLLSFPSWLCQFWQHHLTPRVEETLFHSRRMDGQHHQQTVSLLLRAVLVKAFKPTCPLQMEGTGGGREGGRGGG